MSVAYVDTSCLVALALSEPGWEEMAERLGRFDSLFSSPLLEAEFLSVLAREELQDDHLLSWINWIHPGRSLGKQCRRILEHGYLRGADVWHLACAVYLREQMETVAFLTLDERQGQVARELGFGLESRP